MYTKRTGRVRGNGTLPPTFAWQNAETIFDGIVQNYPVNGFTDNYFDELQISKGTRAGILGGLRWLGVVNRNEIVLADPDLPSKLENTQTRLDVFKDMVRLYPEDMFDGEKLKYRTTEQLTRYFERLSITHDTSKRAARLFQWLSEQAGYKILDKSSSIVPRREHRQVVKVTARSSPSVSVNPNRPKSVELTNETRIKVQLLQAYLDAQRIGEVFDASQLKEMAALIKEVGALLPPRK